MNVFINFFRDVLDGPVYITVAIISVILICAGIGYFAERKQKREVEEKKFEDTHVKIKNIQENKPVENVSTGGQKVTISNANATNKQYGVPSNITKGRVESKVVPGLTQPKPVSAQPVNTQSMNGQLEGTYLNQNPQQINNINNNQNMVYQNTTQVVNSVNYNQPNTTVPNNTNYSNSNTINQPTNYGNQTQTYNNVNAQTNTNINNSFTN